jgi:DNA/RNA-binding domain of Phe-tRNA-synthetase-like protein
MELMKSEAWTHDHQGAVVGMLIMRGVTPEPGSDSLAPIRARVEAELRSRFPSIEQIRANAVLQAYKRYYARFGKTYHVSQQLESVVLKGKTIPAVIPLVTAFFTAELKNLLLTAGHDLAALAPPFEVGSATADEHYVTMRGEERALKPGDMRIADSRGVISSILLGPDQRSRITPETRDAAFFVYAPAGVGEEFVRAHLDDLRACVLACSPSSTVETVAVVSAT